MTDDLPPEKTPQQKAAAVARLYRFHEATEALRPEEEQCPTVRRSPKNPGPRKTDAEGHLPPNS